VFFVLVTVRVGDILRAELDFHRLGNDFVLFTVFFGYNTFLSLFVRFISAEDFVDIGGRVVRCGLFLFHYPALFVRDSRLSLCFLFLIVKHVMRRP